MNEYQISYLCDGAVLITRERVRQMVDELVELVATTSESAEGTLRAVRSFMFITMNEFDH